MGSETDGGFPASEFWDAGYGFEIKTLYRSGWTVLETRSIQHPKRHLSDTQNPCIRGDKPNHQTPAPEVPTELQNPLTPEPKMSSIRHENFAHFQATRHHCPCKSVTPKFVTFTSNIRDRP